MVKPVAILGMGKIPPLNRNPYNGYINPYYWVDDHPLLYGNNGSLDPGTYRKWLGWPLWCPHVLRKCFPAAFFFHQNKGEKWCEVPKTIPTHQFSWKAWLASCHEVRFMPFGKAHALSWCRKFPQVFGSFLILKQPALKGVGSKVLFFRCAKTKTSRHFETTVVNHNHFGLILAQKSSERERESKNMVPCWVSSKQLLTQKCLKTGGSWLCQQGSIIWNQPKLHALLMGNPYQKYHTVTDCLIAPNPGNLIMAIQPTPPNVPPPPRNKGLIRPYWGLINHW